MEQKARSGREGGLPASRHVQNKATRQKKVFPRTSWRAVVNYGTGRSHTKEASRWKQQRDKRSCCSRCCIQTEKVMLKSHCVELENRRMNKSDRHLASPAERTSFEKDSKPNAAGRSCRGWKIASSSRMQ